MKLGFTSPSNQALPKPLLDSQPLKPPRSSIATTATIASFHHSSRFTSATLFCSQQEFDIAFRPGDRAWLDAEHGPPLAFNPAFGLGAHALMNRRIADDAALPHFRAAR